MSGGGGGGWALPCWSLEQRLGVLVPMSVSLLVSVFPVRSYEEEKVQFFTNRKPISGGNSKRNPGPDDPGIWITQFHRDLGVRVYTTMYSRHMLPLVIVLGPTRNVIWGIVRRWPALGPRCVHTMWTAVDRLARASVILRQATATRLNLPSTLHTRLGQL
jgi:hypothetical protein